MKNIKNIYLSTKLTEHEHDKITKRIQQQRLPKRYNKYRPYVHSR